jgi:hypothetical protein
VAGSAMMTALPLVAALRWLAQALIVVFSFARRRCVSFIAGLDPQSTAFGTTRHPPVAAGCNPHDSTLRYPTVLHLINSHVLEQRSCLAQYIRFLLVTLHRTTARAFNPPSPV